MQGQNSDSAQKDDIQPLLNYRLNRHDRTQLELKLNYGIRPNEKQQRYRVSLFMFVPRVLALTKQTYQKDRFYQDSITFIRMTTPQVPLHDLSKKNAIAPWADPVQQAIGQFADGNQGDPAPAIRGIKLLACVLKSAVRDAKSQLLQQLEEHLRSPAATGTKAVCATLISDYGEDIRTALRRLRKVGEKSSKDGVPISVRECWRAADEYTSLLCEEALTDVIVLVSKHAQSHDLEVAISELRSIAIDEYHHRRDSGFFSYAVEGERNEYLPHRWRVLKRYVSSALYLHVSREQAGMLITDIIGMLAAALAMLFATVAMLMATTLWGASLSMAFIGAMVVSYVIKDRIKELGKRHLGQRVRGLLPDHLLSIQTRDENQTLGSCKETFFVAKIKDIDSAIVDFRYCDLASHDAIEGRPETVICYEKEVVLSSSALAENLAGATGLTDVVRLNVSPMLARMDDTWETYRYIHPRTRMVNKTRCARVYHINIVLKLIAANGEQSLARVRVVMNKKGIVRVENIDGHQPIGVHPAGEGEPADNGDNVAIQINDDW